MVNRHPIISMGGHEMKRKRPTASLKAQVARLKHQSRMFASDVAALNEQIADVSQQVASLYAMLDLLSRSPRSARGKKKPTFATRAELTRAPDDLLLLPREAAALLGIGLRKLRDLRRAGDLKAQHLGYRTVRFSAKSIRAYLRQRRRGQPGA